MLNYVIINLRRLTTIEVCGQKPPLTSVPNVFVNVDKDFMLFGALSYVIINLRRLTTIEVCGQKPPLSSVPDVFLNVDKDFMLFRFLQRALYLISKRTVCFTDCKIFQEFSFF